MGRTVSRVVGRQRIVALDSGALIALSREDVTAAALVAQLRRLGATMVVPAPVLAEVLRGTNRDAPVHRISWGKALGRKAVVTQDARDFTALAPRGRGSRSSV